MRKLEETSACLSQADLLHILKVNPRVPSDDLQKSISGGESIEVGATLIAQEIMAQKPITSWFFNGDSDVLFVEGRFSSPRYARDTPLSIMSSRVVESFCDRERGVVLYFFCALHNAASDDLKGPCGMMRVLISQLLQEFSPEYGFPVTVHSRRLLETLQMGALCDLFGKVFRRVTADMVLFIVIDSICFFEKSDWVSDTERAIRELQHLIDKDDGNAAEGRPVLKLLVTSPYRSKSVRTKLPTESQMLVSDEGTLLRAAPDEKPPNTGSGQSARMIGRDIVRALRAAGPAGGDLDVSSDEF